MAKIKTPGRAASAQRDDVKDWSKRRRKHLEKAREEGVRVGLALAELNALDEFLSDAPARANQKPGGKGRR